MYSMRRQRQQRRQRFKFKLIRFVLLLAIGGLVFNYVRPLPHADASVTPLTDTAQNVHLSWPANGSAAIGAQGFGVLATHGSQAQHPTASVAKLITSLAVLEKMPLDKGQQGPSLTMTQADVDLWNHYYAIGGSYVKVEVGEKISEYQALQALLLPSANNMADSLAIWAFGSMDAYHAYATDMLKKQGLNNTVVAVDASGMSPATMSTPADLIKLGELALQNPVITEIIHQPSATIPVHGVIYSTNSRFDSGDVFGIKTGLTDEAGGNYLFAANYKTDDDKTVTIIGVTLGQNNLIDALKSSEPLIRSAKKYFAVKTPVKAGEVFATLTTPWLTSAKVVAKEDIRLVSWNGTALIPQVKLANINRSLPVGAQVGTAIISSGENKATTPLVLQQAINGPSWQWRMKRF